ncbi:DUF5060 domain-containing protein [Sphingobacterium pedocola]|uniref:DUF5060 domain-containing protein n=1 Tax=Sphingobacterium pedocola TaxID=2082722 RepID=UPI001E58F1FC|nr:DUF5060 domain-containing protein [Sphingobacterium pedocola]
MARQETVPMWKRIDIPLTSDKVYGNPFLDVMVDAIFTHESGQQIAIPGFWNGGNQWIVRFSPNQLGKWTYSIRSNDSANVALAKAGDLLAVANHGSTELDRRGFVQLSSNNRYFTYSDGHPFFWLGDTHWQAPDYERLDANNDPNAVNGLGQFKDLVENRLRKGFNIYQTYPDAAENDGGGNPRRFNWWVDRKMLLTAPDAIQVNPEAFRENFDVMMDYLADRGMTIALGFGVHQANANKMHQQSLLHWARYLVARYAAYPVIWITAQEVNASPKDGSYEKWMKVAQLISELDGYKRPLSMHTDRDYPGKYPSFNEMKDISWHQFWAMQGGHLHDNSAENQSQAYYEKYWNATPRKPFIETEANYEQLHWPKAISADQVRETAWRALQSGSYGYTYGASGIWAMNWEAGDGQGWETWSKLSWYEAKDLPGSFQMGYMKQFYCALDFHLLEPRFGDNQYVKELDHNQHFLSSIGDKVYVLYSKTGKILSGRIVNMRPHAAYAAFWFNPRKGTYHAAADSVVRPDREGGYTLPNKPDDKDWVYVLRITNK